MSVKAGLIGIIIVMLFMILYYRLPGLLAALALIVYAAAVMVWLQVLSRMALSIAFPLMGLSYVLVYLGAAAWPALDEPLSLQRFAGTGLIMCGVALVAGSR